MTIVFVGWTADYDRIMIQQLTKTMPVKAINFPEGKLIFHVNRLLGYWPNRIYLKLHSLFFENSTILIFKDSDGYGYIRNADVFKQEKIVAVRNIVSAEFIQNLKLVFKRIYSFDKTQCSKYLLQHMDQIIPLTEKELGLSVNDNVCFFVGLDKNRVGIISEVASELESFGIKCNFLVVRDSTSKSESDYYIDSYVGYSENIRMVQSSKYILEINQKDQEGLTLRTLEAMFFERKLITNNQSLKNYDFYDESRVFIYDSNIEPQKFKTFMSQEFKPIEDDSLDRYRAESFLKKILSDHETKYS